MTHGLITESGFECCVFCWQPFAMPADRIDKDPDLPGIGMGVNYTEGEYCHAETGNEYETIMDTPAGEPLAHPACYKEWKAAVRPDDEADLTEFSQ